MFAVAVSVVLALALSGGGWPSEAFLSKALTLLGIAALAAGFVFPLAGFYRRHTRSTSLRDVTILSRGAALAIVIEALLAALMPDTRSAPLSLYVIQFLIATPVLGGLRVVARRRELIRRRARVGARKKDDRIPVILVGTGANCDLFVRALRHPDAKFRAVGIIDDVRGTLGLYFHEVQILGSLRELDSTLAAIEAAPVQPKRILLTEPMTQFDTDGLQRLITWAGRRGVSVGRVPGLSESDFAADGGNGGHALRTVDPEEILSRPQYEIERSLLRELFAGRRVLITGAGGSIGSELTRQIAACDPAMLVLIDNCEFNAYSIDADMAQHFPEVPRQVYVASIRDARRIQRLFQRHQPELVFHAAALKHVPMVEMNPSEGVLTNVIGTRNLADAARNVGAIAMVQVSTDKAVNATSVMGATKRVAEFYVQAQDRITTEVQEPTRFFSVRFGNVLGSSGSLIPLFQRQISEGGPLTVTDPRMERFFMTIREAVELTLVAAAKGLAQRAGLGEIFVLDMGAPVKIVDLAERMIRLAGLEPGKDIGIKIVGTRPGEKLFEELFDKAEERRDSGIEGVSSALPDGIPIAELRAAIRRLESAARDGDDEEVRHLLHDLVPGYAMPEPEPKPEERHRAAAKAKLPAAPRKRRLEPLAPILMNGAAGQVRAGE